MPHFNNKTGLRIPDNENGDDSSTDKCKSCGTLYPREYIKCPKCKPRKK